MPVPWKACTCHSSDYAPRDWAISITELLRVIQFYNAGAYHRCDHGEDGFCPGVAWASTTEAQGTRRGGAEADIPRDIGRSAGSLVPVP